MSENELEAPLVVQAQRGFHVLSLVEVLDDTKEVAASWASEHISLRPDFGWIVGRYVEADKPNRNGHIFPLEDLRAAHGAVVHTPLNMLHRAHHVVGTFTATNLLEGVDAHQSLAASEQAAMLNKHVEAIAAFWRYAFPDEYRATQQAFRERSAWLSMEAVPKSITCMADNKTFAYRGPAHDSYCAHLLASPRAQRKLNGPHFVGGAIIIPPTRPGWQHADIRDVAGIIEQHVDEADDLFNHLRASSPHLTARTWEELMTLILADMYGGVPTPTIVAKNFSMDERKKMAKKGHAMSDGSFPIDDEESLKNAIRLAGNAKDPAAAKRHIIKRARALGFEKMIPDTWKGRESAAEVEVAGEVLALEAMNKKSGKKGAIVALVPPPDVAEKLAALGTETAEQLHVTLAFLGDIDGDTVTLDDGDGQMKVTSRDAVTAAVAAFCAGAPPINASVSGIGAFALGDGQAVIYASVDAPGLPELRERLVAALAAAGIPISRLHGLSPHMSLEYTTADVAPPPADALDERLEWQVDHLEVWWSDDTHLPYDLADGKVALPREPPAAGVRGSRAGVRGLLRVRPEPAEQGRKTGF